MNLKVSFYSLKASSIILYTKLQSAKSMIFSCFLGGFSSTLALDGVGGY